MTMEVTTKMQTTNTAMPYIGTRDTIFIQDNNLMWLINESIILCKDAAFYIGLTYWTAQLSKWESQSCIR
jgi:hypothetical protein